MTKTTNVAIKMTKEKERTVTKMRKKKSDKQYIFSSVAFTVRCFSHF